ncbi:hypothetical protein SDC9_176419 [bioreactor metagenome]|uniref:Uncharacterized protein n=1 Tax=bioreactor metagenome TaxID=1076179 RepID=A0A645GSP8_9ZZZZ
MAARPPCGFRAGGRRAPFRGGDAGGRIRKGLRSAGPAERSVRRHSAGARRELLPLPGGRRAGPAGAADFAGTAPQAVELRRAADGPLRLRRLRRDGVLPGRRVPDAAESHRAAHPFRRTDFPAAVPGEEPDGGRGGSPVGLRV